MSDRDPEEDGQEVVEEIEDDEVLPSINPLTNEIIRTGMSQITKTYGMALFISHLMRELFNNH
jgi:hypothetical protein